MSKMQKRFLSGLLMGAIIFTLTGWTNVAESQEKYPTRGIDFVAIGETQAKGHNY